MNLFAPVFFSILAAGCALFIGGLLALALWVIFLAIKGQLTTDAE